MRNLFSKRPSVYPVYLAIALLSAIGFLIAPTAGQALAREHDLTHQAAMTVSVPQPFDQTGPATVMVSYAAGWNLVGGPAGTMVTGNLGPLYTFRAGDMNYETVTAGSPLTAGFGYWAYFTSPMTITLVASGSPNATAQLPAGQFVMIGNPSTAAVTVTGADIVYSYSPAAGYQSTTTLQPGQGAWAFSNRGATVTIGASQPTSTPVATATPAPTATTTRTATPMPTATPVPTATPTPMAARVTIINLSFNPATITVTRGSTVTWMNSDSVTHTVTSDTGSFDLGFVNPGMSVSMTFNTAGTFNYHCSIHPFMTGTVTVQ